MPGRKAEDETGKHVSGGKAEETGKLVTEQKTEAQNWKLVRGKDGWGWELVREKDASEWETGHGGRRRRMGRWSGKKDVGEWKRSSKKQGGGSWEIPTSMQTRKRTSD